MYPCNWRKKCSCKSPRESNTFFFVNGELREKNKKVERKKLSHFKLLKVSSQKSPFNKMCKILTELLISVIKKYR